MGEGKGEGSVKYEGQWKDGLMHKKGTLYYSENKLVCYKGDWVGGVRKGHGELYDKTGKLLYKGNFDDGKFSGKGTMYQVIGLKLCKDFWMNFGGKLKPSFKWKNCAAGQPIDHKFFTVDVEKFSRTWQENFAGDGLGA
jgi:antitoxin component YwqK of YwqJK toxin-antitoxin module